MAPELPRPAIYAVTLEKEGWEPERALARARAAYGLTDDTGSAAEPTLSETWRKEMMQELAEGHPGSENKSPSEAAREYSRTHRKRRKSR